MKQKKRTYGKILLPVTLAAALLSLTACGSGDSANTSTIASITNEASVTASTVNGEVPYTFFDDTVFVGDSVSLKLNLYVSAQRKTDSTFMGTAQFLTPGSYGTGNELKELGSENSVHPSYNGTEMYLADAIEAMGAKKVFIMLGMNDIATNKRKKSGYSNLCPIDDANRRYCTKRLFNKRKFRYLQCRSKSNV